MHRSHSPMLFLSLLLAAPGCGDDFVDADEGLVAETEIPVERRGEIPLRTGYLDGQTVSYYFMSTIVPAELSWFASYDKFPGMATR